MKLSNKAIQDLRIALRKSYGEKFDIDMSDDEVNNIGILLLTSVVENLKIKMKTS
jgi:hypothetical protein